MKNPKYDITFKTETKNEIGGEKCTPTTIDTVEGISFKALKEVLKEQLDLFIEPGGKPFRPTCEDVKEMGMRWGIDFQNETERYQNAYDLYKDILDTANTVGKTENLTNPYVFHRTFDYFNMQIIIFVYR